MTQEQFLDQFFTPESLTKYITSYVLYYQISLGRNVYESIQDIEETKQKLQELNLSLEPNDIVQSVFLICINNLDEHIFDNIESFIQKQAFTHSLLDFIQNDSELLNKESYQAMKQQTIANNTFFDSNMKMQFLKEYPTMYKNYEQYIDQDYAQKVRNILKESFL